MNESHKSTLPREESLGEYRARLQATSRPLIERVNNQWQNEKDVLLPPYDDDETREISCCDLEQEGSCAHATRRVCSSRRIRRILAVALLSCLAFYYIWSSFVQPRLDEEWAYKEGFVSQDNGTYGIARGGDMDPGLVRIKDLDRNLVPGGQADPEGKRRLVFVGDVHGCKKELVKLLEKVRFSEEMDHLILTGDTISKGPDNAGVLDELIRLKATSVRGNHEDRILHVADALEEDSAPTTATSSKGFAKDTALLKQLKPRHLKYLRDMPLMLHIASLPQALQSTSKSHSPISEHLLVVHAGLVPGVHLSKQDPYFVMNMRSINRRTHVPSAMRSPDKNARPWFDVWGWYNNRIFRKQSLNDFIMPADSFAAESEAVARSEESSGWFGTMWKNFFGSRKTATPQVVVYGHDSKTGLQIHRWSKGLDSGCVGGGKLTAMVLDAKGRTELFSVGCKDYRD